METNENKNEVLSVLNELMEKVTTLQTSFNDFTTPKEEVAEDVAEETVEEVAEEIPEEPEVFVEETEAEEISDEEVDELAELLY